jgi:hypothetical protein
VSVERPTPERYALTKAEAAASLGMSVDSFERHVQPNLKVVRIGKLRLVPPAELERFVAERAEHVLNGSGGG